MIATQATTVECILYVSAIHANRMLTIIFSAYYPFGLNFARLFLFLATICFEQW